MRIAMFSVHTCPLAYEEGMEIGGMNVYTLELGKSLAKKGNRVDIFTRSQDTVSPKVVNAVPNLRVVHLKAGPEKPIPKDQIINYLPEFTQSFFKFVGSQTIPYDIIHCHYYLSGLAGMAIKNKYGRIPLIMTFHTLALAKNSALKDVKNHENKTRIRAEFDLVRVSDKIIAMSNIDKKNLVNFYRCPTNKIQVINPGVNGDVFKPMDKNLARKHIGADTDSKLVVFAGRIDPVKGIEDLFEALKIIFKRKSLPLELLIISGSKKHRLPDLPYIKFVDQQAHDNLPYYYNAADVVVMPSYYEAFGMVALEAAACGTPIITTTAAGISQVIDQKFKKMVITASNPGALADRIEEIIEDSKIKEKFKIEMQRKLKPFSWTNIATKIGEVYLNSLRD
jgi:D-inositol-3-phosphate glycosyltransferase